MHIDVTLVHSLPLGVDTAADLVTARKMLGRCSRSGGRPGH